MNHLGFTGTKDGLTSRQKESLFEVVVRIVGDDPKDWIAHHGDCVGGDDTFDHLCEAAGVAKIFIHPGHDWSGKSPLRALCGVYGMLRSREEPETVWFPSKPYLDRNNDIAEASDIVIACPKERDEQLKSGTWSTVRRARKRGKHVILIYPDGTVEES